MSLRYRLFLWISALFLAAGGVSYFVETIVSKKELKKTRVQLEKKIDVLNEEKRKQITRFLSDSIQEIESRIQILLERLSTYPLQAAAFAPTQSNLSKGTWLNAAEILLNYPWLDFIQNRSHDQVLSLLMPSPESLHSTIRTPIKDSMAWIELKGTCYLGLKIQFIPKQTQESAPKEIIETPRSAPSIYLLFDPKAIATPSSESLQWPIFTGNLSSTQIQPPWINGAILDIASFEQIFQSARHYLQQISLSKPPLANPISTPLPDWTQRYDQRYLIWGLAAIHASQLFGPDLFSQEGPQGVALYLDDTSPGYGISTQDPFFNTPIPIPNNAQEIDFIAASHLYFGSTIQYRVTPENVSPQESSLTLGVDAQTLLDKLVLAINQTACLVHEGKIVGALSNKGLPLSPQQYPSLSEVLNKNSGIIPWGKDSFYFLQITPRKDFDLHFFLFNPVEVEFSLLNSLAEGASQVIHQLLNDVHLIGFSMLFLAILILHYLSVKITRPIAQLAAATAHITESRWNELSIPIPSEKENDEVASLCRAFHEMVKGLQEKEKVKAVLNKVVSRDIAQEILKGAVHLGGEEKRVTVLFADIRHFTAITQKMDPKEVIELLNDCMTRLSHILDHHGGVIDKYVGDEVMALFGAPVTHPDSAYQAILAALEMLSALNAWNTQRQQEGKPLVEIGVGIHTGTVLAGNMGAENRLNYTVLGSNVNLAARLCAAALPMQILISEETLQDPRVADHIECQPLPPMQFKGFDAPVTVYEVKGSQR